LPSFLYFAFKELIISTPDPPLPSHPLYHFFFLSQSVLSSCLPRLEPLLIFQVPFERNPLQPQALDFYQNDQEEKSKKRKATIQNC